MTQSCPISFLKTDENVARLNAGLTTILISVYVFTEVKWIIFILMYEFLIKGIFLQEKLSIFTLFSKNILKIFKVSPKIVDAGPKIFAARLGFIFTMFIFGVYLAGMEKISDVLAGILGFFAGLEAIFGFCIACKIYPLLKFS
ncbi:MAG: DUF4395 domain-containing protein [Thermodesulfobacteria bacterium]|nr:DUF4395 domain-containing protein [Thermodesulfobacteriota bacterium]